MKLGIGSQRSAVPVVLLGLLLPACGGQPGPPTRIAVGERAPEFSLPALDGTRLDSRSLRGQAVVLNFWATWCQPCRREIPDLVALANAGRAEVIGIALDQEGERVVRPFVERLGIPYTVLLGNQEIFEHFDGLTIPYTLLLGPDLDIVRVYRGAMSRSELEKDLDGLRRAGDQTARIGEGHPSAWPVSAANRAFYMSRFYLSRETGAVPARWASDPGAGRFLRLSPGGSGEPGSRGL